MALSGHFISCDWGTSNFRLRFVKTGTLDFLSEHKTDMGIKKYYQLYKQQNVQSQQDFFADYLLAQLDSLEQFNVINSTVVASGMLSSSLGMLELPYAELPLAFNGENLISRRVTLGETRELIVVSGARTNSDVIRGEEIQAIGLSDNLPKHEKGLLLLPGTHSKHMYFEGGRFVDFTTYMTGELFEVVSRHSILAASLDPVDWNPSFSETFLDGVAQGLANREMAAMFSIRAKSLIHNISKKNNYYFLSGLLIGAELSNLKGSNETVYLAVTGIQNELYTLALESFLPKERIVCFEPRLIEKALLAGHRKILLHHDK